VQLSGTLADGSTVDVSCDAGERVRLIPGSIAGGSLVVHDDGASTCIENCYAGLTGDLTGNFTLQGNGTQLFSGPLTIWAYAHTRPWWLTQPTVQANADLSMFPKYGPGSENASWYAEYQRGDNGPMGIGNTLVGIGSGGERPALGPLPQWLACYLANPTPENLEVVLGMETSSGPWAAHCIDPKTEKMLLASDYQFATMLDTFYGQKDNPVVKFTSATPLNIAQARTHATVYCALGAALFGNSYFRDELSQWTNYIQCLSDNPTYRITPGSCLAGGAPRGKARGLTLQAYASRYSAHPAMFDQWMQDTATEWNALYLAQTGLQVDRNTGGYPNHGFAPWQMHALIYAIGHAMHMGYSQFQPTFDYFTKWLLDCVLTDHEFSTAYNLALADANGNVAADSAQSLQFTAVNSVNITNALKYPEDSAERIAAFFPGNAAYKAGDFSGNPWVADSFAIQLKSPLAMCVDHATDQARAQSAWAKYQSHFRADVSQNPKYNILPRAA